MAAKYVTVVFKDSADGYEFPVASYVRGDDAEIIADALAFAERAVLSGDFRPEGEFLFDRIERQSDLVDAAEGRLRAAIESGEHPDEIAELRHELRDAREGR